MLRGREMQTYDVVNQGEEVGVPLRPRILAIDWERVDDVLKGAKIGKEIVLAFGNRFEKRHGVVRGVEARNESSGQRRIGGWETRRSCKF